MIAKSYERCWEMDLVKKRHNEGHTLLEYSAD
jgi:hypothetical protein